MSKKGETFTKEKTGVGKVDISDVTPTRIRQNMDIYMGELTTK